jgi:hypothetical protein
LPYAVSAVAVPTEWFDQARVLRVDADGAWVPRPAVPTGGRLFVVASPASRASTLLAAVAHSSRGTPDTWLVVRGGSTRSALMLDPADEPVAVDPSARLSAIVGAAETVADLVARVVAADPASLSCVSLEVEGPTLRLPVHEQTQLGTPPSTLHAVPLRLHRDVCRDARPVAENPTALPATALPRLLGAEAREQEIRAALAEHRSAFEALLPGSEPEAPPPSAPVGADLGAPILVGDGSQ